MDRFELLDYGLFMDRVMGHHNLMAKYRESREAGSTVVEQVVEIVPVESSTEIEATEP